MTSDLFSSLFSNIWALALMVFFFGGSIFVHELGHFLAARMRGLHVERFSIGFGPKIVAWKRNGVEYRLAWLPFGGYVALPQLADMRGIEGDSPDAATLPPIGFLDKMIVSVAGPVFNIIFAFLLACILWQVGQPTRASLQTTQVGSVLKELPLSDGTKVAGPAFSAGIQPGDYVEAIDGQRVDSWLELEQTLFSGSGRTSDGTRQAVFTIRRGDQRLEIKVNPQISGEDQFRRVGIEPADDLTVDQVIKDTPAQAAGMQEGDRIVSMDGDPVYTIDAFRGHLQTHSSETIAVGIVRGTEELTLSIKPALVKDERTGKDVARAGFIFTSGYMLIYQNPIRQMKDTFVITKRVLAGLINPRSDIGLSQVSGPPGIARAYIAFSSNIRLVIWFTAVINIGLAVFNLLPIPILDGGHMLFATIGKIRGRALPQQVIMTAQSISLVLLMALMVYVCFNDIRKWVRDARSTPEQIEQAAPSNP